MRLRLASAAVVFVGSYLPLSAILLVQDVNFALLGASACWPFAGVSAQCVIPLGNVAASLGSVVVCGACFAATLLVLRVGKAKTSIEIVNARYVPSELMSYALPYIVAFMNLDFQTNKLVGLVIFLGWLFWISYRSGQIVMNPFLVAFGWRLYEVTYRFVESPKEHHGKALCDDAIVGGERCRHTMIHDVVIIRKKEKGGSRSW